MSVRVEARRRASRVIIRGVMEDGVVVLASRRGFAFYVPLVKQEAGVEPLYKPRDAPWHIEIYEPRRFIVVTPRV